MKPKELRAKIKMEQTKAELDDLMDFLDENQDLPDCVETAISVRQDILMNDISAFNRRINQEADSQ
jgi:hypothetical protein